MSSIVSPLLRTEAGTAAATQNRQQLGVMLLERGLISPAQLDFARQKQAVENKRIGQIMVDYGLALEYDVAQLLAEQRGLPFMPIDDVAPPDPSILGLFNKELCLSRSFLPLRRTDGGLEILLGDSDPRDVAQIVKRRCDLNSSFVQTEFTRLQQQVRQSYYFSQNPVEQQIDRAVRQLSADIDHAQSPERLLDLLLHLAVRERATDIHLAPSEDSLHVSFRIDGVLRPMLALPVSLNRAMVYVKLTSEMDISEQRRPQDGSFHVSVLDSPYTVRVSTLASEYGERMVLRLLPERGDLSGIAQLGFRAHDVELLRRIFEKPAGLVLITGPTGSGKSTTLHAALRMQSLIERNVLTVEDPVEYRVPGACQTEVNRRAGYTFSSALRHFLRHDPDVMLIGEIRDSETAQSALESSATGHLVLSTLHVSGVFGVVPRLRPLGLGAQELADNLVAIVNQRLVRRNCPHCSASVPFSEAERQWLGVHHSGPGQRGCGCDVCRGTGYFGRLPVYEILLIDDALANAIADDKGREAIHAAALDAGFQPLREMAKSMVAAGQTTAEEIVRVIGEGPALVGAPA
ncbi:MAG TPA: ATPase, T2SS/T4P/T4SS family [Rhodanobacteraceae bacterium]|nr:ATPase, T2SS/T4P/T4SS family [Rhodanobacteraceae bacterium]